MKQSCGFCTTHSQNKPSLRSERNSRKSEEELIKQEQDNSVAHAHGKRHSPGRKNPEKGNHIS